MLLNKIPKQYLIKYGFARSNTFSQKVGPRYELELEFEWYKVFINIISGIAMFMQCCSKPKFVINCAAFMPSDMKPGDFQQNYLYLVYISLTHSKRMSLHSQQTCSFILFFTWPITHSAPLDTLMVGQAAHKVAVLLISHIDQCLLRWKDEVRCGEARLLHTHTHAHTLNNKAWSLHRQPGPRLLFSTFINL